MSPQNGQTELFPDETRIAHTAQLQRISERAATLRSPTVLDPELVELQTDNLENGAGFSPARAARQFETPAEAGENTAVPSGKKLPVRHLSAREQAFADLGNIPRHVLRGRPGYEDF